METTKTPRVRYALEFKQEAVRLVEGGQSIAAAARTLGVIEQTLFNWVEAKRESLPSSNATDACRRSRCDVTLLCAGAPQGHPRQDEPQG